MRPILHAAVTLCLAALSVRAAQLPGLPQRATPTALIVGQVIDAGSGRPITGAVVEVSGASLPSDVSAREALPPSPLRAMTGTDGRFVVRGLPRGSFTIAAVRPGYLDGAYGRRLPGGATQSLILGDGQKAGVVRILMWRHAAISGVVIDEAGEPVIGIPIRAMRRTIAGGRRRFTYAGPVGWTDDRGMYRIAGLLPGEYIVTAVATQVAVAASMALELRQGGLSSVPLAQIGASIVAGGASSMQVGDSILTLGRSAIGPAPASDGRLFVYPTTFHPNTPNPVRAEVLVVGSGEERAGIDLHIRPVATARISGMLAGTDGRSAGIQVQIVSEDADDSPIDLEVASTVTDRSGNFIFPVVPSGHQVIRVIEGLSVTSPLVGPPTIIHTGSGMTFSSADTVSAQFLYQAPPQTRWASVPLTVGREDIAGLTITLQQGLRITGRFEYDGVSPKPTQQRLMQMAFTVESANGSSRVPPSAGQVQSSGQFSASGLPGGKYVIRVRAAPAGWYFKSVTYNGRDISDVPLDVESGDVAGVVITFTDRLTELTGTVRTGSGAGDSDATVLLFPTDTQAWPAWGMNPQRFRSARTMPTGAFTIGPVPPGDYYIVAIPDEQSSDWQDPRFLDALSRVASQVSLSEGDKKPEDLRTKDVR